MSLNHSNISIFVPHLGCKHMCSFCNQVYISGHEEKPDARTIEKAVEDAVKSPRFNSKTAEIAFFGGSFTAIDMDYQNELLSTAYKFIKQGVVRGIRISTRPDAIDENILDNLKKYGVTSIELGAQSMDDEVLFLNKRGHSSYDVEKASKLIKEYGFELGLQMMTGLFGDTYEKSIATAEKIADLKPETVRIYPTIVLKNTYLAKLYEEGKYSPQTLEEASEVCGELLSFFESKNINVIRLGLHSIEEESFIAGPWHWAFGELCVSSIYMKKAKKMLEKEQKGNYTLIVNKNEISKMIGQRKSNITVLRELGYNCTVIGDEKIEKYSILIKKN